MPHTITDTAPMPPEAQSREPEYSVDRISFPFKTILTLAAQVITMAIFFTRQQASIDRQGEILTEMRDAQKERNEDDKIWRGKTEADLQQMRVRLAIIESNLHLEEYENQKAKKQ